MNGNAAVSTGRLSFDCGSHNETLSKGKLLYMFFPSQESNINRLFGLSITPVHDISVQCSYSASVTVLLVNVSLVLSTLVPAVCTNASSNLGSRLVQ